jgi:hypothetical protein
MMIDQVNDVLAVEHGHAAIRQRLNAVIGDIQQAASRSTKSPGMWTQHAAVGPVAFAHQIAVRGYRARREDSESSAARSESSSETRRANLANIA